MTPPRNAQRALYSDILNLSIARKEFDQLQGVLHKTSVVYEVSDLLTKILEHENMKEGLLRKYAIWNRYPAILTT